MSNAAPLQTAFRLSKWLHLFGLLTVRELCRGGRKTAVLVGLVASIFGVGAIQAADNRIVVENRLSGSPASEWDVPGSGSTAIQGFATDISYNVGATVQFKVKTTAKAYRLDIYRIGYYNGAGARKKGSVAGVKFTQPSCKVQSSVGLVDCGNWAVTASWAIPADAVSGVYFAKLVRTDNNAASHIFFVVRDDSSHSDLLVQTSDTTWQAYNAYGGSSLYVGVQSAGRTR